MAEVLPCGLSPPGDGSRGRRLGSGLPGVGRGPPPHLPARGSRQSGRRKATTFVYQGFTTHYSCDGLLDKVRGVLLDFGARKEQLKVVPLGCSSSGGRPDPFPGVRMKMRVLQPAGASKDQQGR